jgi:hypothetical protein
MPGSSTNLCWLNEWRWGLCLSYLYCLRQGMCSLLIQPLYRIICGIIELAWPLYKNNCYTTGCWLDPFYGMTWKSLKTWKIVYFSSDMDKSIIYEKFKGINWSLHCNYLYYLICDGMLGTKHLKTFGLVHLGHKTLSDLINIHFKGLLAGNYESRRKKSVLVLNLKSC